MSLFQRKKSLCDAVGRELKRVLKEEAALRKQADRDAPGWKSALEAKVPEKAAAGLRTAFAKAFAIVFEKGTPVIDKTYHKTELIDGYMIQDYAVRITESRRELKRLRGSAAKFNLANAAITTAEGIGLGALGIGMPDIVVFIGFLLKGAYECAARYGCDCDDPRERLLILRMMEAALLRKDEWVRADAAVDALLTAEEIPSEDMLAEQIRRTSDTFAMDMLALKFIQGLPLVGIVGGLSNPVYYNKIMRYVQLKYYKRYLLKLPAAVE